MDGTLCDPVFAPFVCANRNESAIFCGHLVRSNPLLEILSGGPLASRLVFQAADGYISPSVYAEKLKSAKVVPTWNYVACQFYGVLEKVPDHELLDLLAHQVNVFEQSQDSELETRRCPCRLSEADGQRGVWHPLHVGALPGAQENQSEPPVRSKRDNRLDPGSAHPIQVTGPLDGRQWRHLIVKTTQ